MHQVTIHEAKTHLSRLVQEVLNGEEVVIARGKVPVVKLTLLEGVPQKRFVDTHKGAIRYMAPDFDAPLDDFKDYM